MENIKIQENYFYKLDNLKDVKIIWKRFDKANILEVGIEYPTAIVDLDRFSGIKITEEWLLKFGFKHSGNGFYIHVESIIELANIGYKYFHCGFKGVSLCDIHSVHQLQNLYFALTQNELTIK